MVRGEMSINISVVGLGIFTFESSLSNGFTPQNESCLIFGR